jgi:hypothetical protein
MRRAVLAAVLAACSTAVCRPAAAQFSKAELRRAQEDPRRYTLDESSVRIEDLGPALNPSDILPPPPGGGNPDVIPRLNDILNLGQRLWAIVEANRPVVDVGNSYASALPGGLERWTDLTGWSPPKGVIYRLTAKNLYGMSMVDVRFSVQRTYGGSFHGKGKYLTAVTVLPLSVDVGSGYRFDLGAAVPDSSVVNVGTPEDPIAAMTPVLTWRVRTVLKDSQGRAMYYVRGDGAFSEVDRPGAPALADAAARGLVAKVAESLGRELQSGP